MKKPGATALFIIIFTFFAFTIGLFAGRNINPAPIQISVLPSPTASEPSLAENISEADEPATPQGPVNINTADLATLDTLPGIGPVIAQRIIDYRENNGPFERPEQLGEVKGIGHKTLEKILDCVTVGG